jgi:transposase
VWNILEGQFEILLVNAQHIKACPGARRTRRTASGSPTCCSMGCSKAVLCRQRQYGNMRDLTRYRVSLAQECNRIANRVQKVLEDANVKLASVATDALGASGRAMLDAIIGGESDSHAKGDWQYLGKSPLDHVIFRGWLANLGVLAGNLLLSA